jgi:hypothetical protein
MPDRGRMDEDVNAREKRRIGDHVCKGARPLG